jgi:tetratricopeptide (TPR) repeat protein
LLSGKTYALTGVAIAAVFMLLNLHCGNSSSPPNASSDSLFYYNHHDTVKYVGMETCRSCHNTIYKTFIQTGMGQSFGKATRSKSAADFSKQHVVFDKENNYYYTVYWQGDNLFMTEFRLQGKDTVHKRTEQVSYIIGSGQHTNSHLMEVNGYLYQMPMTWYAQQKKWDLPPGFENGRNSRFTRIIGEECMSCHNAMPAFVKNSENKFNNIPLGIDCERCHGPGEVHVKEKLAGNIVDTTGNNLDRTIVNPRHLSWERQIDLCQRCHLQGNSILKPGKTYRDFKPGQKLSDFWEVFMPRFAGADKEFIMASHADRLQQSQCFIQSNKGKQAQNMPLTCITCHNPHVSVKVTGKQVFNAACNGCHTPAQKQCSVEKNVRVAKNNNDCAGCHMPRSGTMDIPHVTVHDHYIRKPADEIKTAEIKLYIGLASVNGTGQEQSTRARGHVNYYERFEGIPASLDSALQLAGKSFEQSWQVATAIHVHYLRSEAQLVIALAQQYGNNLPAGDVWTYYRVGQSYMNAGDYTQAESWLRKAHDQAPEQLDFLNKLAECLIQLQQLDAAVELLDQLLKQNPKYIAAINNKGFAKLLMNNTAEANLWYEKALRLDPDYEPALLNKAGLYNALGEKQKAKAIIQQLLQQQADDAKLKALLKKLE